MNTEILMPIHGQQKKILTSEALEFAALLHQTFNSTRVELLEERLIRQAEIDSGHMPNFLTATEHIRQGDWKIAELKYQLKKNKINA